MYFDDGIVASNEYTAALRASQRVKSDLQRSGLVAHMEKSVWDPTQTLKWLGFDLNLSQGVVSVPTVKIEALRDQLRALLSRSNASADC